MKSNGVRSEMMKDVPQAATLFDVICSRMFRWPVLLLTGCRGGCLVCAEVSYCYQVPSAPSIPAS